MENITEELIGEAIRLGACDTGAALARALLGSPVSWLRPDDLGWLAERGLTPEIEPIAPPPEVFDRLAGNEDCLARYAVTLHPSCTPDVLKLLAGDAYVCVRSSVARRPACPPEALARLADDADVCVRWFTAHNHSCPPEVLARLADDEDANVRMAATKRQKRNAAL